MGQQWNLPCGLINREQGFGQLAAWIWKHSRRCNCCPAAARRFFVNPAVDVLSHQFGVNGFLNTS
jgi:hypothetical protein